MAFGRDFDFSQANMPYFRRRIALDCVAKALDSKVTEETRAAEPARGSGGGSIDCIDLGSESESSDSGSESTESEGGGDAPRSQERRPPMLESAHCKGADEAGMEAEPVKKGKKDKRPCVYLQHHALKSYAIGGRWARRGAEEGVPAGFHTEQTRMILRDVPAGTGVRIAKYMNTSVVRGEHGAVIPADEADRYRELDSDDEENEMVTVEVRRKRTRKNAPVGARYHITPKELECLFAPEVEEGEGGEAKKQKLGETDGDEEEDEDDEGDDGDDADEGGGSKNETKERKEKKATQQKKEETKGEERTEKKQKLEEMDGDMEEDENEDEEDDGEDVDEAYDADVAHDAKREWWMANWEEMKVCQRVREWVVIQPRWTSRKGAFDYGAATNWLFANENAQKVSEIGGAGGGESETGENKRDEEQHADRREPMNVEGAAEDGGTRSNKRKKEDDPAEGLDIDQADRETEETEEVEEQKNQEHKKSKKKKRRGKKGKGYLARKNKMTTD